MGQRTLAGLRRLSIEPLAFADNNTSMWGKKVDGVRVLSVPDAVEQFGRQAAFVITIWKGDAADTTPDRCRQVKNLGCSRVISFGYLYWKYPDNFLPYFSLDLPHKVREQSAEVKKALALWADEASRVEYLAHIQWRMWMDFDVFPPPVTHEVYFPDDLAGVLPDDDFIDCGAFDGDTIRILLRRHGDAVGKIIAFEPDPANFRKLQDYASTLPDPLRNKLVLHNKATGKHKGKVRFNATGTEASAIAPGGSEVDCVPLDEILAEAAPGFIKMDIEGAEIDTLAGARNIIRKHLPVLAVSAYHNQDHVWKIPLLISSFSDQYRFFLRSHQVEAWGVVCYAIPKNRLKYGR